ncbi:hypothetical protein EV361DRAFT_869653 [Lentinula raphanica]|nr:hypothetical protein EV361DRAFT_869653 [Lentinula raphanica]
MAIFRTIRETFGKFLQKLEAIPEFVQNDPQILRPVSNMTDGYFNTYNSGYNSASSLSGALGDFQYGTYPQYSQQNPYQPPGDVRPIIELCTSLQSFVDDFHQGKRSRPDTVLCIKGTALDFFTSRQIPFDSTQIQPYLEQLDELEHMQYTAMQHGTMGNQNYTPENADDTPPTLLGRLQDAPPSLLERTSSGPRKRVRFPSEKTPGYQGHAVEEVVEAAVEEVVEEEGEMVEGGEEV